MTEDELKEIHGDGICHICGQPKFKEGSPICSYPHGMIPDEQVGETGMWSWKYPVDTTPNRTEA